MLYDYGNYITRFIIFIFTIVRSAIYVVFVLEVSLRTKDAFLQLNFSFYITEK